MINTIKLMRIFFCTFCFTAFLIDSTENANKTSHIELYPIYARYSTKNPLRKDGSNPYVSISSLAESMMKIYLDCAINKFNYCPNPNIALLHGILLEAINISADCIKETDDELLRLTICYLFGILYFHLNKIYGDIVVFTSDNVLQLYNTYALSPLSSRLNKVRMLKTIDIGNSFFKIVMIFFEKDKTKQEIVIEHSKLLEEVFSLDSKALVKFQLFGRDLHGSIHNFCILMLNAVPSVNS